MIAVTGSSELGMFESNFSLIMIAHYDAPPGLRTIFLEENLLIRSTLSKESCSILNDKLRPS
jgi:hypothetical protein